jgi:hypothetical protein
VRGGTKSKGKTGDAAAKNQEIGRESHDAPLTSKDSRACRLGLRAGLRDIADRLPNGPAAGEMDP